MVPSQARIMASTVLLASAIIVAMASEPRLPKESDDDSLLQGYWRTSHSLAVIVKRPQGVPRLKVLDFYHQQFFSRVGNAAQEEEGGWFQPNGDGWKADDLNKSQNPRQMSWWWIVGIEKQGGVAASVGVDDEMWQDLSKAFAHELTDEEKESIQEIARRKRPWPFYKDSFNTSDPKVQTILLGPGVFFRAIPQGRCDNRFKPPRASFLPQALPSIPDGWCVLELCELHPNTKYRMFLYNISDDKHVPDTTPKPVAEALATTKSKAFAMPTVVVLMKVAIGLAMLVAVIKECVKQCIAKKESNYEPIENTRATTVDILEDESVGGFFVKVNLFLDIFTSSLTSMSMFLPIVGPLGLVLASDVIIGTRLRKFIKGVDQFQNASAERRARLACYATKDLLVLIINIVIIPFNILAIQVLWNMYWITWFRSIGINPSGDSSFEALQRYGYTWLEVSGLEQLWWVVGMVLSSFMLVLDRENDRIAVLLRRHKKRAEALVNELQRGRELWTRICKLEGGGIFGGTAQDTELSIAMELAFLAAGLVFALLPHLWMCLRYHVPFMNTHLIHITILYVINVSGVSQRFLSQTQTVRNVYRRRCMELATFQAISWQEQTPAIYDPFATRNDAVHEARRLLKENVPRIPSLRLDEPEDSRVWWCLRELVLIEIKEGHVKSEMLIIATLGFASFQAVLSVLIMIALKDITAITLVTVIVLAVCQQFIFFALQDSRDINLMCQEHTVLLHNSVAEMNRPLGNTKPLDSHLAQERFLLQVATLIEKQKPPETVMSLSVTPNVFFVTVGTVGALLIFSMYMLARGLVYMKSAAIAGTVTG